MKVSEGQQCRREAVEPHALNEDFGERVHRLARHASRGVPATAVMHSTP